MVLQEFLKSLTNYGLRFIDALPRLGLAVLIIVIGVLIANWLTSMFQKRATRRSHDPLIAQFLSRVFKLVMTVIVVMIALQAAGLSGIAGGLLATAGGSAIVLGFAFRNIAENFIAGIILAFNRPFHTDDTIQVGDAMGKVRNIRFRYIHIKTFDGKDVYVPNSDALNKPLHNYTADGFIRMDFAVSVAHDNNVEQAKSIVMQCVSEESELKNDETHHNFIVEEDLTATAVKLRVYFWVDVFGYHREALEARGRVMRNAKDKLLAAGFKIA